MISEQLEFQISQYADGTLPAEEVAALEAVLAGDAEARALVAEYRSLDATLKRELPLPNVRWDRLAEHLSKVVAGEAEADDATPAPISLFARLRPLLSIAASLLIGFGLATLVYRGGNGGTKPELHPTPAPDNTVAIANSIQIAGPTAETTTQPTVVAIDVDAAPVAKQVAAAEAVVYRPPRVVIASGQTRLQDTQRLPF